MADEVKAITNSESSGAEAHSHQILSKANSTYESVGSQTNVFLSSVRTYIAGILMPTIAVTISAAFNQSPRAQITIPADPRLFNVGNRDRVPVQIFVKETVAESPEYILMFEGFIASRSYLSLATQREINLNCVSYTEVFNDSKIKFMATIDEVFVGGVPGNNSFAQNVFMPDIAFPKCLFLSGMGLVTPKNEGQAGKMITMPTEYLANLIEFMEEAGTRIAPAGKYNDSIVSKYFSTLAYNLHFDRRFCWLPYFDVEMSEHSSDSEVSSTDDTTTPINGAWEAEGIKERGAETATMFPVLYGVKADAAMQAVMAGVQTSSREFSITDLLSFLVEKMEYEFLVIPNPAYIESGGGTDLGLAADSNRKAVLSDSDLTRPDDQLSTIENDVTQEDAENIYYKYAPDRNCDRMVQFCLKPMFDDSFPPQCNVIFRSQVTSLQAETTYYGQPTRIQVSNFNPMATHASLTGTANPALSMFGSVDFYPSSKYGEVLDTQGDRDVPPMSEELLEVERYTGPWIHKDTMPSWMFYAFLVSNETDVSAIGENTDQIKKMREQYMRRQLMRAQILNRQLTAQCVFLPYVTCGFPALIYDTGDSGFSFAGNVIAYEHSFNAGGMTTSVSLNGVRLLAEAVSAEQTNNYPNPINSVHVVTHNVNRLEKVYGAILGYNTSGAKPVTWANAKAQWSATVDNVATNPQTNIYEAYKLQRRNVTTFTKYCKFMGITKNPDGTDETGEIPTELSSDWLNDRAKITVFQSVPLRQKILPVTDLEIVEQNLSELDKQIEEAEQKLEKANAFLEKYSDAVMEAEYESVKNSVTTAQAAYDAPGGNTEANLKALQTAQQQLAKYEAYRPTSQAIIASVREKQANYQKEVDDLKAKKSALENAAKSVEDEKQTSFSSDAQDSDVRELLKEIRDEEAQHYIY